MISIRVVEAWRDFQGQAGLKRPLIEEDYLELLELMHYLIDHHNCDEEPYSSLLDLVGSYMHDWELDNEPDLKLTHLEPFERLALLMERRSVSQYQLAKEGLGDQGNLSRVLSGKAGISKKLAKRLASYFDVSVELFI